jgi:hypothetical protein
MPVMSTDGANILLLGIAEPSDIPSILHDKCTRMNENYTSKSSLDFLAPTPFQL